MHSQCHANKKHQLALHTVTITFHRMYKRFSEMKIPSELDSHLFAFWDHKNSSGQVIFQQIGVSCRTTHLEFLSYNPTLSTLKVLSLVIVKKQLTHFHRCLSSLSLLPFLFYLSFHVYMNCLCPIIESLLDTQGPHSESELCSNLVSLLTLGLLDLLS